MDSNEIKIPELEIYQCSNCKRKVVAETGSQLLCDTCVKEFLARNIGLMIPVEDTQSELDFLDPTPKEEALAVIEKAK
jgi:hypothetical protein